MKKRIIIPLIAIGIFFTTVSFKSDFFEIAKQIEIFTTLFKELNMNYVYEVKPSTIKDKEIKRIIIHIISIDIYFTTVNFKCDFFEIAKQIEIIITIFK